MKLRWGIMSTANIAISQVMPGIRQSETGELAAIASRDRAKAKEAADTFGIEKAYGSYEELLADDGIDAVYIPLPNHLHLEWTLKAAVAGKHVLCEKPLALTAMEAEKMVEACRSAGVHLAEAFMYRHHPHMSRIREIVASGEIGQLRAIRGAFSYNNDKDAANIRYRSDWGGGAIYDVGCYPLSAGRWITGKEPVASTVVGQFSQGHGDVDMMASGLVEFPDGVALTFDCGMWTANRQFMEIVGSTGSIDVLHPFRNDEGLSTLVVTVQGERREEISGKLNRYALQADDFARAVTGEKAPIVANDDAISNMRLLEASLQSAKTGKRIEL
ncbi:Gfo/Idh/MocA family protein [Gorillibacterium massiliense]|uniref:Gfo/Idh/MocA family protein n=1 Tax=Gorillibacterium massiliense TaxID=1280390 RepID=UPI0004AEC2A4|nr:Gfo/Idh/MocA family oxidoreductase [Gorillibacterium massiliense]